MSEKSTPQVPLEAQADKLGGLLWRMVRTLRALDATEQVCCGITPSQCYAILAFSEREEMAMAEFSSHLSLAVSTATRLVDSLVNVGLIERRRPDDDRRTVLVRLTPDGHNQLLRIKRERREMLTKVLLDIPEERRDEVIKVLSQLLGVLISEDTPCCG